MKTSFFLLLICLLGSLSLFAQKTVRGNVLDAQTKEPLPGVSVFAPGTTTGVATDMGGKFQLTLPEGAADTLAFSFVGYQTRTCCASPRGEMVILLEPATLSLETVVVSASRDAQPRTQTPVAISTLSAKQLEETKPTYLPEVLNKVPGVLMVNLGNEQHAMSIRQPVSYRGYFLYLEDGIPVRPAGLFNHNALIEVNMFGIRSVEVIKGPASSVYGSEAIGGAVNFITQAPSYTPTAKIGLHGDGWNYRRVQFSASNFVTRKLGVFLGGYCARQRNGWQGNSDFDKLSLNLRADYFLKEGLKLVGSFSTNHLHTQTGGSLDSTGFYSRSYNTLHTFTYRKVDASRARLSLQKYWSSGGESGLTAFGRGNRIGQLPNYSIRNVATDKTRANGEINENTFRSYGLTAQHVQPLAWLAGKLIGGVYADLTPSGYRANYIAVDRDPNTGQYVSYTNRPDSLLTDYRADLLNTAAYAQVEWNPVPTLRVVAGLRYDRLDYRYDNHLSPAAFSGAPDDKNRFQFVTPKIGITYNLAEGRGLYANTSVGAYAPGINELYRGVKVPVLQPARFDNYEAGGWMTLLDGALQAEVSLYQMNGRREIVSYLLPDHSTENRNSGRTLHQGVEYSLNYAPGKQWALRLSGTNARHRYIAYSPKEGQTYNGKSMPNAPAWIANAEVTCKPAVVPGLRLGLEWQRVGSWYKDDNNDYRYEDRTLLGLRGVSVLHLRAGYAFGGFEVYANVTNLTDELYAQNVSRGPWGDTFSPAAGRTVAAGVHYTFKGKEKSRE